MSMGTSTSHLQDRSRGRRRSKIRWGHLTLRYALASVHCPVIQTSLVCSHRGIASGWPIYSLERARELARV